MCSAGQQVGRHKGPLSELVPARGCPQSISLGLELTVSGLPQSHTGPGPVQPEGTAGKEVSLEVCSVRKGLKDQERTQFSFFLPSCLFESASLTGLEGIGSLCLQGMKRLLCDNRESGCQPGISPVKDRRRKAECKEPGRRPGEIAGGRQAGRGGRGSWVVAGHSSLAGLGGLGCCSL